MTTNLHMLTRCAAKAFNCCLSNRIQLRVSNPEPQKVTKAVQIIVLCGVVWCMDGAFVEIWLSSNFVEIWPHPTTAYKLVKFWVISAIAPDFLKIWRFVQLGTH